MRLPAQDSFCRGAPPAPPLLLPLVGRPPCVPPPTYAVPSTAGHIGPALQAFRRGRCPHRPARTAPPKNVIANRRARRCGNPYPPAPHFLSCGENGFPRRFAPRNDDFMDMHRTFISSVGRHPCVPPPIYAAPSTAGHIGPALQAFRRGRCPHRPARTVPPKNCHCEPVRTLVWQSVIPPHRTSTPRVGGGVPDVPPAPRPLVIPL